MTKIIPLDWELRAGDNGAYYMAYCPVLESLFTAADEAECVQIDKGREARILQAVAAFKPQDVILVPNLYGTCRNGKKVGPLKQSTMWEGMFFDPDGLHWDSNGTLIGFLPGSDLDIVNLAQEPEPKFDEATVARQRALSELDASLCNFTNSAGDPWDPVDQWRAEVEEAFKDLCIKYNEAHKTGLMHWDAAPLEAESA